MNNHILIIFILNDEPSLSKLKYHIEASKPKWVKWYLIQGYSLRLRGFHMIELFKSNWFVKNTNSITKSYIYFKLKYFI